MATGHSVQGVLNFGALFLEDSKWMTNIARFPMDPLLLFSLSIITNWLPTRH